MSRHLARLAPKDCAGLVDQKNECGVVGWVKDQALGEDDLVRGIDRDLAVVAGDEAGPARHESAVTIGEVALRLGRADSCRRRCLSAIQSGVSSPRRWRATRGTT